MLDSLGLELQTVVSCRVGTEPEPPLQEQPTLFTAEPSLQGCRSKHYHNFHLTLLNEFLYVKILVSQMWA